MRTRVIPRMNKFANKCIVICGVANVDALFNFPKFYENMVGIIKIAESIEGDGP